MLPFIMPFNPIQHYVLLDAGGSAKQVEGGEGFWSQPETLLNEQGKSWLVSEFNFSENWKTWEMHPQADEVVYLTQGKALVLLEQPTGLEQIEVVAPGMLVVPRGVWHTAKASEPCRMLFITMGAGTMQRPAQ